MENFKQLIVFGGESWYNVANRGLDVKGAFIWDDQRRMERISMSVLTHRYINGLSSTA